MKKEWERKE